MQGLIMSWTDVFTRILEHPPLKSAGSNLDSFTNMIRDVLKNESTDADLVRSAIIDWKERSGIGRPDIGMSLNEKSPLTIFR